MSALTARLELSAPARISLATLLVAVGAIHLAMVPSHASSSRAEGLTFAIAGSVQLMLGVIVAQRPSWLVLGGIVAVSAACIGAWVVSRTSGLPYGAHRGQAEAATSVDITTVVFEFATLVMIGVLALWPGLGRSWSGGAVALASVGPVIVLVFSAERAVITGCPRSRSCRRRERRGRDAPAHRPIHRGRADGHARRGASRGAAGRRPHRGARCRARTGRAAAVARYPTVAQAHAAGMYDATSPGRDTPRYFVAPENQPFASDPGFDLEHPLVFLYLGRDPRSPLVGVAYLEFSERGPRGFTGPTDSWRLLRGLCSIPTAGGGSRIVSIDSDMTQDRCTAVDGSYADSVQWLVHAWLAPGWENPDGVFSESNPRVPCVVDAYVRWLDTARGTGRAPGPDATEALTTDLAACSPGSPTDR